MTRKKGLIGLLIVCFLVMMASTALAASSKKSGTSTKTITMKPLGAGLPDGFLD